LHWPDAASAADGIVGGQQLLGAMMEGQFTSFFAGKPSPLAKDGVVAEAKDKEAETGDAAANAASQASADNNTAGRRDAKDATDQKPSVTSVIERSPESARIILVSSGSFLSDEVLELAASIDRTQYLVPVSFAQNLIDWSLEDRGLLALRSRGGQFSRTLVPMEAGTRMLWEYVSYSLALLGLGIVYLVHRYMLRRAGRNYLAMLSQGA